MVEITGGMASRDKGGVEGRASATPVGLVRGGVLLLRTLVDFLVSEFE